MRQHNASFESSAASFKRMLGCTQSGPSLEPVRPHLNQKLVAESHASCLGKDRVNSAAWTKRGDPICQAASLDLTTIHPILDLGGREYLATIEAAGPRGLAESIAVGGAQTVQRFLVCES